MGKLKVRMPKSIRFNCARQVGGLQKLESKGLIKDFKKISSRIHSAKMIYTFGLAPYFLEMPEGRVEGDFSNYKIKVVYGVNTTPQVFITSHKLDTECPHLYEDGQLCLYKPSIFVWKNCHSIAKDIIPLVYAWLYFYEKWVETDDWLGPEATH